MKKSLLALIIAPLFVHAAETGNKVTEVRFGSLYHDSPVRFLEKKSDGDRAAGISELHQSIDYLGQNIRENNASLGELQGEITRNQRIAMDETSQLDDKITSIGGVVESTNQKINTLMVDLTDKLVPEYMNSVLPGLVGDEVREELDDYNQYMSTQINLLERQADQTEFAVQEVEKTIESAKVVTSVIMDATISLEADVDALNTRVSNASKKANVTNNVATGNRKDIDQNTVKIEKNALDMLKNRQDLRGLENDLRETNERLDNGLAANAALNGLFQPYGIGKLNITAAMGGYNSTQAVAVGTGYRFNENIAMKTGVSYTGSNDVMYNMAVNLEW